MPTLKEYATLTELMAGREPGSVKVRGAGWHPGEWCRPMRKRPEGDWFVCWCEGDRVLVDDKNSWLIVSEDATAPTHTHRMTWFGGLTGRPVSHLATYEVPCPDAPALDTLRLEIAARVLAGIHATTVLGPDIPWGNRHAYALAEADALIAEARK